MSTLIIAGFLITPIWFLMSERWHEEKVRLAAVTRMYDIDEDRL